MTAKHFMRGSDSKWATVIMVVTVCVLPCFGGCRSAPAGRDPVSNRADTMVLVHPGLLINVSVLVSGKKEIEETAKRVSDAGELSLPLLGSTMVENLTVDQLISKLTESYRRYFVDPQVIVEFTRDSNGEGISPWGYVTVLGRVKNPGRIAIPATRDLTVSGAIQKAGGFNSSARMDSILITSRDVQGRPKTRSVDLHAVGMGGRVGDDVVVSSEDIVFVPERKF